MTAHASSHTTAFLPAERAPEAVLRQQSSVVRSAPLVPTLLDAMAGFVLVLNANRQLVYVNEAFATYLAEHHVGDWLGQRPGEVLGCVNARKAAGGCGTHEACTLCGAGRSLAASLNGVASTHECRIQTESSGDDLDLLVRATPLTIGDETFIVFSAVDISHEKRRHALERIFFHDITNTAGGIKGLAGLMAHSDPQKVVTRYAPMVEAASVSLLDEITSHRDLASAERGELVPRPAGVSARALLEELVALARHHEVARGKRVTLRNSSADPMLQTDRALLGRVLGNLIKNALEAEPAGAEVTVSCRSTGRRVAFEVHNPSVMPREVQLQLFQRSFSTKGPGRGLGTYSIRLLGERYLGGTIGFRSTHETGTVFVADFPAVLEQRPV